MYSHILVPVDLENAGKLTKALDLAGGIAKEHDAEVIYVDVVDAVPTSSSRTEGDRMATWLKAFATEQADKHGITTRAHVALRGDLHLNIGPDVIKARRKPGAI